MKKILLSIVAIGLLVATLQSCERNKKSLPLSDSEVVKADTIIKREVVQTEQVDIPIFSNEAVNKELAEYVKLKDAYVTALKSQNQAKIQALAIKYTTWAQSAAASVNLLKPDEVQKYSKYITKLSNEWALAAQEAVK